MLWAFSHHVSVHLLWCWCLRSSATMRRCLSSDDPLSSGRFTWRVAIHMVGAPKRSPQITRSPVVALNTPGLLWVPFSLPFLMWILPSLNSAVGSPFLCPISSALLPSWQRLVSCLWKLLLLLPGHMVRLHFPALPEGRGDPAHDQVPWTDPNYLLCPALPPALCPRLLPFLIQWLNADNHGNLKSQCWIRQSHETEESWIPASILGGELPAAQKLLFSTLYEWEINCSCIWAIIYSGVC